MFFFFKQKTAYEMRISDWSSDVCSSDLKGFPVEETVSLSSGSPNSSVSVEGDVRKTVTRVVGRKFAEVLIAAARGGTGRLPDRRSRPSRRFPRSPCYAAPEQIGRAHV